ncbi:MAG: Lcl C-terminal domain-containing protein, partial [Syntrophales bacterium]
TGLMWAARDNGSDINWSDAKSYCDNYRGGGHADWRMPTEEELAGLYDAGKARPLACGKSYKIHVATVLIDVTCFYLWSSEAQTRLLRSPEAAYFYFIDGGWYWNSQSYASDGRVLPVRSGK